MAIEGDVDVRMILKGNDEHGHLYMGMAEACERRTQTCDHGLSCTRNERHGDGVL